MHIYLLTNTVNGKCYVGQTTQSVEARWKQHCRDARRSNFRCRLLSKAIRKHGASAFSLSVLVTVTTQAELDRQERTAVVALGTLAPAGYNLHAGGRGVGSLHPETKARLRAAAKGRPGRPLTVAQRKALRAANIGRKASPETRLKLSLARKGKPLPEEVRARMRSASRKPFTPEHRSRIAASLSGRQKSDAHRAALSVAMGGRVVGPLSPAHREKLKQARINWWAKRRAIVEAGVV